MITIVRWQLATVSILIGLYLINTGWRVISGHHISPHDAGECIVAGGAWALGLGFSVILMLLVSRVK